MASLALNLSLMNASPYPYTYNLPQPPAAPRPRPAPQLFPHTPRRDMAGELPDNLKGGEAASLPASSRILLLHQDHRPQLGQSTQPHHTPGGQASRQRGWGSPDPAGDWEVQSPTDQSQSHSPAPRQQPQLPRARPALPPAGRRSDALPLPVQTSPSVSLRVAPSRCPASTSRGEVGVGAHPVCRKRAEVLSGRLPFRLGLTADPTKVAADKERRAQDERSTTKLSHRACAPGERITQCFLSGARPLADRKWRKRMFRPLRVRTAAREVRTVAISGVGNRSGLHCRSSELLQCRPRRWRWTGLSR